MWLRKSFLFAQVAAVIVLPAWIVVAAAIAPESLGSLVVLPYLAWPVLAVSLAAVLGLTWARRQVREQRAVSSTDVAVFAGWYALSALLGVFLMLGMPVGVGITAGLVALASIAAFWASVAQLVQAAKRRIDTVFSGFAAPMVAQTPAEPKPIRVIRLDS